MKYRFAPLKTILASILGMSLGMAVHAQFTTVAYDGFSYSAGSLSGNNGGTGWTSAWINDYTSGASFAVITNGLSYSGLTTSGGSIVWGSGGNGISEDSRDLPLLDSGIVYVQFLGQFGSSSGGGTPNLRLLDSGSVTGGFGGNGGTYGADVSILNTSLNPASDGSSSSSASLSSLNLIVGRIDYEDNTTTLWVDPNLSTFNYQSPPTPDATYADLAPAFDEIAFYSRDPASVDEITIMAEPAPEPSSAALLAAGIGLLVSVHRIFNCRRKNLG